MDTKLNTPPLLSGILLEARQAYSLPQFHESIDVGFIAVN